MKILIVDDNEMSRKLLRVTLQAEGYDTVEAVDGVEAFETLEREGADVVISDILMPNMDGYSLCHAVRHSERFREIPFLVHTSTYDSSGDEKLALHFGADKFLRKPSPAKQILKAIQEVTDNTRQRQDAALQPLNELEVVKTYSVHLVKKLESKNDELMQAHAKILDMHQALLRRTDELEQSEELFRSIFENILDVFYRTDMQGTLQIISPSVQRYGYRPETLIGTNIQSLFAIPTDLEEIMKGLALRETIEDREIVLKRQDGASFVASLSARLLIDFQRRPLGIEGTLRDITERKRLENQLLQAQKMESIGRLAGGVAHDFNNMLTVIAGHAELAKEKLIAEDPLLEHINAINQAGERAANLTRQLLAFARQQVIVPQIVNINDLARNMDRLLHRLIGENIELLTVLHPSVGRVRVDPGQFEQILVNLAVNARDAMPDGGKLTIETTHVSLDEEYAHQHPPVASGEYVLLTVSDTGLGMEEAIKEHIFEPFFTTKEQGKGTGLGLATVYGIVRQSGGHIWLYSEVGRGTTFKIYLPQVLGRAEAPRKREENDMRPKGTETILLVEDEPALRSLAAIVLQKQGYNVLLAADGEQALLAAAEYPETIHLLVTDVIMPQMGGKELAAQLQARIPSLKILYNSGYTDDAIVHHGVLEEGVSFLQKPFTPTSLALKVREVLDADK